MSTAQSLRRQTNFHRNRIKQLQESRRRLLAARADHWARIQDITDSLVQVGEEIETVEASIDFLEQDSPLAPDRNGLAGNANLEYN